MTWLPPILTSSFRLVVISVLLTSNSIAVWKTSNQGKARRLHERAALLGILGCNLLYLYVIWAPFTLFTLTHDLVDLHNSTRSPHGLPSLSPSDEGTLLRRSTRSAVVELYEPVGTWSLAFSPATHTYMDIRRVSGFSRDLSLPLSGSSGCNVQDLVMSACSYSLGFIAVLRLILSKKPPAHFIPSWALGSAVGVLIVLIFSCISLVRLAIGKTLFASRSPEMIDLGYQLYNIICDVHIDEDYVLTLFLEWVVLFSLLLVAVATVVGVSVKKSKIKILETEDEVTHLQFESLLRDVVLGLSAVWAWPIKPALVLILFVYHGNHWTSAVCWLSHLVIAVPVVFVPVAVFLPTRRDALSVSSVVVEAQALPKDHSLDKKTQRAAATAKEPLEKVHKPHSRMNSAESSSEVLADNLKVYLGKDIFKGFQHLPSSLMMPSNVILRSDSSYPSISEA